MGPEEEQTVRMMVPAVFQSRTGRQTRVDRPGLQRKPSISVRDFEKIRLDHFLYADMTEYVYTLEE